MEALRIEPRSAERAVGEADRLLAGGLGSDLPAVSPRWWIECEQRAATGVEQRARDVPLAQVCCHLVERVTVADAAEVEVHVVDGDASAEFAVVEHELVHAGRGTCGGEPRLAGFEWIAIGGTPDLKEWADGDVEDATGLAPDVFGERQAVVGGEADLGLLAGGEGVDPRDVAGVLEAAELALELVEVVEGLLADAVGVVFGSRGSRRS